MFIKDFLFNSMKHKKLKSVIVLSLLFATSFLVFIPTTSSASSPSPTPNYYVTITLKNSQSIATVKNFPQMLKINWSNYSGYLNANVSNIRFYDSTTFTSANELTGWIETNNTTTAKSSTVWVNLSSDIIPESASIQIYMGFLPKTSSWSSHWGLSPTLSTKYGQFDNGANVFTFYDNFAGTTVNTSKWQTVANYATDTQNNGLTLCAQTSEYINFFSKNTYTYPLIVEGDYSITNYAGTPAYVGPGETISTSINGVYLGAGLDSGYYFSMGSNDQAGGLEVFSSSGSATGLTSVNQPLPDIIGMGWQSTGTEYGYVNDNSVTSSTDSTNTISNYYLYVGGIGTGGSGTGSMFIQWYRARIPPPNNAMPTVSLSSVQFHLAHYFPISLSNVPDIHKFNITLTGVPSGTGYYQQLLTIDPATYGINSQGSNVLFYDSNGTELYAWLQSINSTSASYWIKNFNGSSIINMQVLPSFENLFSANGYLGEAPELSSTYAEYDNGKNVFNYYTNFAGTSLPSGWIETSSASGNSYSINNGITLTATNAYEMVTAQYSNAFNPQNNILDFYGYFENQGFGGVGYTPSGGSSMATSGDIAIGEDTGIPNAYLTRASGSTEISIDSLTLGTTPYLFSLWENTTEMFGQANYQYTTPNSNGFVASTSLYPTISLEERDGTDYMFVQYLDIRTYVTSMPAFAIGTGNSTAFTHEIILESD